MACSKRSILRVFQTRHRDYHDVLTLFCGPTHDRLLPDDLLREILEVSGLIKFGTRGGIVFEIYFPPIHYKAECPNVVLKTKRSKGRKDEEKRPGGSPPFAANIERTNLGGWLLQ